MPKRDLEPLFSTIRECSTAELWSKAVQLTRNAEVVLESEDEEKIIARVLIPGRAVSPRVTLWLEDEDWSCDTDSLDDPCINVIAAAIAIKNGVGLRSVDDQKPGSISHIAYVLTRSSEGLVFERYIVRGEKREQLKDPLAVLVGGISSGRIQAPAIAAAKEDYAVELALGVKRRGCFAHDVMIKLLSALSSVSNVELDGESISVSPQALKTTYQVTQEKKGYRLKAFLEVEVDEIFKNGVIRTGTNLQALAKSPLDENERKLFSGEGAYFPNHEAPLLFGEILPHLEQKIEVENLCTTIPDVEKIKPRTLLQLDAQGESLLVTPKIVYGDPPIAELSGESLLSLDQSKLPIRDRQAELILERTLQLDHDLQAGRQVRFTGESAVDFVERNKDQELHGDGVSAFSLIGPLKAKLLSKEKSFDIAFETRIGQDTDAQITRHASPERVFQAWRENASYVPLSEGGWAPVPRDWLNQYAAKVEELLALKDDSGNLAPCLLPSLVDLCEELEEEYPDSLASLREKLHSFRGIPESPLPTDLCATLRGYQRAGVDWLQFLKKSGMGAMLADDMGLGKTLQALCVLEGRTLVVVPTSVLYSWVSQLKEFRPNLSFSLFYGRDRKLDSGAQVILTSYGTLRIDSELLAETHWDTIVLDEAQTIKNPQSQVARAAHSLNADFRITLSGTPVENNLDDLWSQFHFLNRGLLGNQHAFKEHFSRPILRGEEQATKTLRRKIKPFILRRMKQEVAPELPPRTETVLECELNEDETELYNTIYAAGRKEVIDMLSQGGSVFAALEVLLRLRQACCHRSLVPGQTAEASSKVELLLETLEKSFAQGHRALVFSQWTSFLDLIEPHLHSQQIGFLRLDGQTRNRQDVVANFQSTDGPPLMLISLKAGGVGLTLTAADHIFLMDSWWNPAVEDQAADRAHRIGQENPVLIHRLIAKDTIEERVLELQKKKAQLAASVLEGSGAAVNLSREDLIELLQ